jgi:hypothetical protein
VSSQLNPGEAIGSLEAIFKEELRVGLKLILEKKHLYQSIYVGPDLKEKVSDVCKNVSGSDLQGRVEGRFWATVADRWFVLDAPARRVPFRNAESASKGINFELPSVDIFCGDCGRVQAFNPTSAADVLGGGLAPKVETPTKEIVQTFIFSFQCQSCRATPEAFLIRREGLKLTLGGRLPMEHVDVPKYIPKGVASKYYGNAVVAYDAGFVLAGLFYLRVLIEQYVREQTKETLVTGAKGAAPKADDFVDAYMDSLDDDLKRRFPSLRKVYEKLSAAIHGANEPPGLFESVQKEIEQHFEGKELLERIGKAQV